MNAQSRLGTKTVAAIALSAMTFAAALAPSLAYADSPRRALNLFGDMVNTMADVAASQQEAAAAEPKCWTEKRSTKTAGKTVVKTVKVCE